MLKIITRKILLTGASILALAGILVRSDFLRPAQAQVAPLKTTTAAQTRYEIVARVVRPQWKAVPAPKSMNTLDYRVVHGFEAKMTRSDSDDEFLKRLRAANAKFRLDGIVRRSIFILNADTEWQQPSNFSMQSIHMAVVDQNTALLAPLKAAHPAASGNFKVSSNGPMTQSATYAGPVDYRKQFTPEVRERLRQQDEILLCYQYEQYCLKNSRKQSTGSADGVWMVLDGETICLNHDMSVSKTLPSLVSPIIQKSGATLDATDCVFFTITKVK